MNRERLLARRSAELRAAMEGVPRAFAACEALNRLPYADQDAIAAAWAQLTGRSAPERFRLVPPVHSDHGVGLHVGAGVFINHGCTLNDIGGIAIGDDTLLGPNVSLLSSGHPVAVAERRAGITVAPIRIGANVWIGATATVLGGVEIGDGAVVAAGAVVTRDVPPATLVAGVPARVVREIGEPPATETSPPLDLLALAGAVTAPYENRVVAEVNDHVVRLSVMTEPFAWHRHPDSDETFLVLEGVLLLETETERVELSAGGLHTVRAGVAHVTRPLTERSVNVTVELAAMSTEWVAR